MTKLFIVDNTEKNATPWLEQGYDRGWGACCDNADRHDTKDWFVVNKVYGNITVLYGTADYLVHYPALPVLSVSEAMAVMEGL